MPDLHERVEHDFTLHPPTTPAVAEQMDALRAETKKLAHLIVDKTPGCREQSLALTKLEEALFYAIAAVARGQ